MGSHILLAGRFPTRPFAQDLSLFLSGAISPDVRYVQSGLAREATHSWTLGTSLNGPFGAGYRHHLAVDRAFYRRCEENPILRRIGAMNSSILAELYAIKRITDVAQLAVPDDAAALWEVGVQPESLTTFLSLSGRYIAGRDPGNAIEMLSGSLRERATRYTDRWLRWGSTLETVATVTAPWLSRLFDGIQAEAEGYVERGSL